MAIDRHVWLFCEECKAVKKVSPEPECQHLALTHGGRSAAPIFTYFEGPNGEVNIPGKPGARLPARLAKLGYQERNIQDSHQYSSFCARMDKDARRKFEAKREKEQEVYEARQKELRSDLRSRLKTEMGKEFYRHAIEAADRGYGQNYSAGSHIEGFEWDNNNGRD